MKEFLISRGDEHLTVTVRDIKELEQKVYELPGFFKKLGLVKDGTDLELSVADYFGFEVRQLSNSNKRYQKKNWCGWTAAILYLFNIGDTNNGQNCQRELEKVAELSAKKKDHYAVYVNRNGKISKKPIFKAVFDSFDDVICTFEPSYSMPSKVIFDRELLKSDLEFYKCSFKR